MKQQERPLLVSRSCQPSDTIISIPAPERKILIGEDHVVVIAGPCAVENHDDFIELAVRLKGLGADILRGGLFKPRTSPYSFRGLGPEGIPIMEEARKITGLPLVSEVMDIRDLDIMYPLLDIIQVGSRNMQNFALLDELGAIDKPVLLKRGFAATLEEWLLAAEYILNRGNSKVILCERGIRSFDAYTRNLIDIGAVAAIKELSHLPVIVDPSHAMGKRSLVLPMARAAVAAGADGIMVEVHQNPDQALSDGQQSITPAQFSKLLLQITDVAKCLHKHF